jgi:hypothetical protein
MLGIRLCSLQNRAQSSLPYCESWSEWTITGCRGRQGAPLDGDLGDIAVWKLKHDLVNHGYDESDPNIIEFVDLQAAICASLALEFAILTFLDDVPVPATPWGLQKKLLAAVDRAKAGTGGSDGKA